MDKMEIQISVRALVEFVMRSGNIDNRRLSAPDNAMQEGSRIHRMIQKRMGAEYQPEVPLRYYYETDDYLIRIDGRADGIFKDKTGVIIDEIKGTYRDVTKLKEPIGTHLAQAKCYAFFYAIQNEVDDLRVRMTYCHPDTEEIKYFFFDYTIDELDVWFNEMMDEYKKWADYECEWQQKRQKSIQALTFPFEYREGQKELVTYVYQTIYHKKKLFIEAPTGVGKTISTIFPSIQAMGKGMCHKIFYLTAKTITRTVAENAFSLLRKQGLQFKSVVLTAKDKICFMEETECNPEHCPYAKGHYDRINDCIYDILIHEDSFTRDLIESYAKKHRVCPFEMCLDISLFSDGVIGDYNYLFDPHVYLKRFFAEGNKGEYIFLVDEAHNLLDRGREMYSAILRKEDFLELKKIVKPYLPKMERQLEKCNKELLLFKRKCEDYEIVEYIDPFAAALTRLSSTMSEYLNEQSDTPIRKDILDFYFEISHFLEIYEKVDDNYVVYTELEEKGTFVMKLFCVNPSQNLKECMERGRSTILFSATFLPIQYYKKLLGGSPDDYEVYAKSVFDPEKKRLLIGSDVTSKYSRRSELEYFHIAAYIHEIVRMKQGNYLVFFPSHAFLRQVFERYISTFADDENVECIRQEEYMDEESREEFLRRFERNTDFDLGQIIDMEIEVLEDTSLVGFCVMGGIFSEGIDLKEDRLIGAIIVGTGLPQVCIEREIVKGYFDEREESGFDYAYRYPGMNKVLQSAGRVIRTADDVGIIALLDDRFLQGTYQKMFPREWTEYKIVTRDEVAKEVEVFWDQWGKYF